MIKAVGKTGFGQPLLILGLSGENITRLMANEPIAFDAAPLGINARVVIVGGRTEDDIVADLRVHGLVTEARDG